MRPSYRRILVAEGVRRQRLSLRSDDLDSVGELYSEDNFRQLVVTVEAAPAFLGGLGELEDHGECGLVGETSLGAHGAVADRCERAFDDVGFHGIRRLNVNQIPARGLKMGPPNRSFL